MPSINVVVESKPSLSARARQIEGMFDVPSKQQQKLEWRGELPIENEPWNIGLIVGPSGCGKSSIARQLWPVQIEKKFEWNGASVIDDFPETTPIHEIAAICNVVGFNTIPAWLRPYKVLSNGEQFRVDLARRLLEVESLVVVDEFTSIIDRQVAKIGSHAVAKYMRKSGKQFVAVACHYDIIDWLNPDWIFEPSSMTFQRRSLRRRPDIEVEVAKVKHDAWKLFAPYHYMSADLHKSAACYCLFIGEVPVAFAALMYRPHSIAKNVWGVSRVVTLPDYQGLGLVFVLLETLGRALVALGQRMRTYPAHPALIRAFDKSPQYRLEKKPGLTAPSQNKINGEAGFKFGGRPNATFEFIGDADPDRGASQQLLQIEALR